jgi:hypothetical protein
MLHGKEAESEASVGGKSGIRVSFQECPTGLVPKGAGGDPAPTENHIFVGASAAKARIANSALRIFLLPICLKLC